MATRLYKTVKPSGQGGDYTTLEACMNANEKSLTGADQYFDVEIDGDWSGGADTSACTVHNYTCDATRYINIYTTSTARHKGLWSSSYYILQASSASDLFTINNPFVRVNGLQVNNTNTASNTSVIYLPAGATTTHIGNTLVKTNVSALGAGGIVVAGGSVVAYIWNTIIVDAKGDANAGGLVVSNAGDTLYVYNCTAHNCSIGFWASAGTAYWKNCGADAATCGTPFSGGTQTTCETTNPSFVSTSGTYDLHLQSGDTEWKDQGTDLSSDANRPFGDTTITTDIDGQTRSGSWDVGADEYVVESTTASWSTSLLSLLLCAQSIGNIADNASSSPLTNLYLSLHTSDPGEAATQQTNECSYTGYSRVALARSAVGWTVSGQTASNSSAVTFGKCTVGSQTATYFGIGSTSSGAGVLYLSGPMNPTIPIGPGVTPFFPAGQLNIYEG